MVVVATVLLAFVTSCNGTTDEKQGDQMNMWEDTMNETEGSN